MKNLEVVRQLGEYHGSYPMVAIRIESEQQHKMVGSSLLNYQKIRKAIIGYPESLIEEMIFCPAFARML